MKIDPTQDRLLSVSGPPILTGEAAAELLALLLDTDDEFADGKASRPEAA